MGSGASKKSSFKETPLATSAPEWQPKRVENAAFPQSDDDIKSTDLTQYISSGQEIIYSGLVWKLNYGKNAESETEWLKRRMWLTNTGGLFYFSQQYQEPLGCNISGLSVRLPDIHPLGRFLLEVVAEESSQTLPTVLATETVEERDAWFKSVQSVQSQEKEANDSVDPLDSLVGNGLHTARRRLDSQLGPTPGDAKTPDDDSQSWGSGQFPSERDAGVKHKDRSYCSKLRSDGRSSFVSSRKSLNARCSQTEKDPIPTARPASMASIGPSVFSRGSMKEAAVPATRRNSQAGFSNKENTVLVLDWDDTIFPTTFVRKDCGLDWRYPIEKQVRAGPSLDDLKYRLETLSDKVVAFIQLATSLAHVVIVTLAKSPWCANSANNFMPRLQEIVQEKGIKVIYARDKITEQAKKAYFQNAFKTSEDEAEFWMNAKRAAMEAELELVHNTKNISWKNIISFGDSDFERVAMVRAADEHVRKMEEFSYVKETGLTSELVTKKGHFQRIRTKTLKMLEEPSCEEMMAQISLMTTWLPHIIKKDEGLDLELSDSTADNELHEINYTLTGSNGDELSWRALVGLDVECCSK